MQLGAVYQSNCAYRNRFKFVPYLLIFVLFTLFLNSHSNRHYPLTLEFCRFWFIRFACTWNFSISWHGMLLPKKNQSVTSTFIGRCLIFHFLSNKRINGPFKTSDETKSKGVKQWIPSVFDLSPITSTVMWATKNLQTSKKAIWSHGKI